MTDSNDDLYAAVRDEYRRVIAIQASKISRLRYALEQAANALEEHGEYVEANKARAMLEEK